MTATVETADVSGRPGERTRNGPATLRGVEEVELVEPVANPLGKLGEGESSSEGEGKGAASTQEEECRFCFEVGTTEDPLVAPCKCRGTIGKVHKSCLRHWILEKGCLTCEICNEPFQLDRETMPSAEELLAYRHALHAAAHHQLGLETAAGDEDSAPDQRRRSLRSFLLRHERLSRWINACILMAFSVIMLLVIIFLIYNWNTYYKSRENVVLVNEIQPMDAGLEVVTGFCGAKVRPNSPHKRSRKKKASNLGQELTSNSNFPLSLSFRSFDFASLSSPPKETMMCAVPREALRNSTALQSRLCRDWVDRNTPCLRYSTYSISRTCEQVNATCR